MHQTSWRRRLALVGLFFVAACSSGQTSPGDANTGTPEVHVVTVLVAPSSVTGAVGESFAATAVAIKSDGTVDDITQRATWASTNSGIVTISGPGQLSFTGAGSASVSATDPDSDISGRLDVTATGGGNNTGPTSLSLSPRTATLPVGSSLALSVTAHFATHTAALSGATFDSSDDSIAAVDADGWVRAIAPGSITLTATDPTSSLTATASLTVTEATLSTLVVTPGAPRLGAGTDLPLRATGVFSDGSAADFTDTAVWSSSAPTVATTSTTGVVRGVMPGTAELRVRDATSGISSTFTVTVTNATLTAVTVTPANPTLAAGTSVALRAIATFSDATTADITDFVSWSSSANSRASVDTSGTPRLLANLPGAPVTITATYNGVEGQSTVTLTDAPLIGIAIGPASLSLAAGLTWQLTATGLFADGSEQDLTDSVDWDSDAGSIASVDVATGELSTLTTGLAIISATHPGSGLFGQASIEVTNAEMIALVITPSAPSVALDTSLPLNATGLFDDASILDVTDQVTWLSLDLGIATIDPSSGVLTALSLGDADITATHPAGTLEATISVEVRAAELRSIFVTPAVVSLETHVPLALTATATFADGSTQDFSSQVTWESENPTLCSVDPLSGESRGLLVGGPCTVVATDPTTGLSGSASLSFTAPTLLSVRIFPDDFTLPQGAKRKLTATGIYSNRTSSAFSSGIYWESDSPGTASVTVGTGLVTGVSAGGPITITATHLLSGEEATATATISAVELIGLVTVPGDGAELPLGAATAFTAIAVFSDNSTLDVSASTTWASSADTVVDIDAGSGVATGLVLGGEATLTATYGAFERGIAVSVVDPEITGIIISPQHPSARVGESTSLTVRALFSDGSLEDITTRVSFDAADPAIVAIDETANAAALTYGSSSISATDPLSGLIGYATFSATAPNHPRITGAPTAVTPPTAGLPFDVEVPISGDVTQLYVYAYTSAGQLGSGSLSIPSPQTSATVSVTLSCFATGPVYLNVTVYNAASDHSQYSWASDFPTYRLYEGGSGLNQTLTSAVPVGSTTASPGSCVFPVLSGPPTLVEASVVGGQNLTANLPIGATFAAASAQLWISSSGQQVGQGSIGGGSGTAVVPMTTSCIMATGSEVIVGGFVYNASGTYYTQYSYAPSISTTHYAFTNHDGITSSPASASGVLLTRIPFTPTGNTSCMRGLTAAPTVSASSIARSAVLTTTLVVDGSAGANVNLYTAGFSNYAGGSSASRTGAGTLNVNTTVSSSANTVAGYYPYISVSTPGRSGSATYHLNGGLSATNYSLQVSDGYLSTTAAVTGYAIPFFTVIP